MKFLCKVLFIAIVVSIFIGLTINTAHANNELSHRQNQLEYIQSQIRESQHMLQRLNQESDKVMQEIREIDQLIRSTDHEMQEIEGQIEEKEAYLSMIDYRREMNQLRLQASTYSFNSIMGRLVGSEEDFMEWSLSSDNIFALNLRMSELTFVYEIYNYAIDRNWSEQVDMNSMEGTLLIERNKIEEEKEMLSRKQDFIQDQLDKKIEMFNQLDQEMVTYASYNDQLQSHSKELEETIRKLQSFGYGGSIVKGKGVLMWPTDGGRITSPFGTRIHPIDKVEQFHGGIDIGGVGHGAPVYASADGIVISSEWLGGYGRTVIIDHGSGVSTLYAHNSSLTVEVGQEVKKGQLIARTGSTGVSTGPHIHFEVRVNGERVNPLEWL